jgi:acyl carrier protein
VNSLDLSVRIQRCTADQIERVAQLTQRTNQFNFTSIRRTAADIAALQADGSLECRAVNVSDRFGDYGLTGLVLFREADNALVIDTLLLSCRVLGRGVEHRVMAYLSDEALQRGLKTLVATLVTSAKNEPARRFLKEIGAHVEERTSTGFSFRIPAAELRGLRWEPPPDGGFVKAWTRQPATHKRPDYVRIARELSTPVQILEAMRFSGARRPDESTEARLAQIWSELLHKSNLSSMDNFFDLGGHSLLAVLLIVRVRETFGVELAIDDVYSVNLTLGELARRIERAQMGEGSTYEDLYKEIEAMSDEEVKQLLAAEDPGVSLP